MSAADQIPAEVRKRAVPMESLDAERGILGSFLLVNSLVDRFADVPLEIMNHPSHRTILEVMREQSARNRPNDLISVTQKLEDKGLLEEVGGAAYLVDLFEFVPSASSIEYYIEVAREKWVKRQLLAMSRQIEALAREEETTEEQMVGGCEELALQLRNVTEAKKADPVQHCKAAAMAALDHIEYVYQNRGGVIGISTGIHDFDRMTSGLLEPNMYVIGGLPASGKTSLAMQIAEHVAVDQNLPVVVFSQEMSAKQLMIRMLCARGEINLQKVRDGFFGKGEMSRTIKETTMLSESNLYLDETPALTTSQLRARCRAWILRKGIKLAVIDYLQLMKGVTKAARDNRQQEIAEISGAIKALAKELKIPIIVLAQISRSVEQRPNQAPKLSDLRESAAIGQDADVVFLLQPVQPKKKKASEASGFDDDEEEGAEEEFLRDDKGRPYNTIGHMVKQREGPVGEVKLMFVKEYTRFKNLTEKLYSNRQEDRQG